MDFSETIMLEMKNPTFRQRIEFVISFYAATLLPEIIPSSKHWNKICDGLILGALPIQTQFMGFGDHGNKIRQACNVDGKPLGAVYSIVNPFEIKGQGLGLKPVSSEYWQANGVKHHLIPMDDFGGNIDIKKVKEIVDDMANEIKSGKSIYIHCKAGKGRSFTFVACYLLMYTDLDVTQVFALMRKQRHQVSPGKAQLDLIEKFRAQYCPHKAPLNLNSKSVQSYRKDFASYINEPVVQAGLTGLLARLVSGSWLLGGAFSAVAAAMSLGAQYLKGKFDNYAYQSITDNKEALASLSIDQLKAVQTGMESANSLKTWGSHLFDINATKHYPSYRGGIRLGQENAKASDNIQFLIEEKSKLKARLKIN